jgi:hypothetical protein
MRPPSASYLARRLLATEIPWTQPHPELAGFAQIEVPRRLEELLPGPLAAALFAVGDPAREEFNRSLKALKLSEQVNRRALAQTEAALPPLIGEARRREEELRAGFDPAIPSSSCSGGSRERCISRRKTRCTGSIRHLPCGWPWRRCTRGSPRSTRPLSRSRRAPPTAAKAAPAGNGPASRTGGIARGSG